MPKPEYNLIIEFVAGYEFPVEDKPNGQFSCSQISLYQSHSEARELLRVVSRVIFHIMTRIFFV